MLGVVTFTVLASARYAAAQQSPPDLRMLLNLDLFSAPPPSASGDQPSAPSMLDQIRTLNSMGYLAGADSSPGAEPGTAGPGTSDTQPAGAYDTPPDQTPPDQPADTGGGSER